MEQAGINTVQLVEAKDLLFTYDSSGNVETINYGGLNIDITSEFPNNLSIQELRNKNGKVSYKYEFNFTELEASNIQNIKRSIYGWVPVFTMFDGTKKVIRTPLKYNSAKQDNNISDSYSTKISNFVETPNKIDIYNGNILTWVLDDGNWNDDGNWLDSEIWLD